MNMLNRYVAAHEIDRRLRDADYHRRVRWGREAGRDSFGRARRNRSEHA